MKIKTRDGILSIQAVSEDLDRHSIPKLTSWGAEDAVLIILPNSECKWFDTCEQALQWLEEYYDD